MNSVIEKEKKLNLALTKLKNLNLENPDIKKNIKNLSTQKNQLEIEKQELEEKYKTLAEDYSDLSKKMDDFRNMQFPSTNRLNIWMVSGLTLLLIIIIYFFSKNISNKDENVLNEKSNEYLEINEYREDITSQNVENYDFMEDSESQKNDFNILSDVLDISADIPLNINSEEKNMLVLEFIDECWVEVYIEGVLIEAQFFKNGDEYSKNINSPFSIVVGNADSVKGTYNTEDIDFITNANRLTRVNTINFMND